MVEYFNDTLVTLFIRHDSLKTVRNTNKPANLKLMT